MRTHAQESVATVRIVDRFVVALTACFGLAAVARVRGEERRRVALQTANSRLQDALVARMDAFDRERSARAAAERAGELQDRFLSTVSHELRTPLNAIVGWAHVIKSTSPAEPQTLRAIEAIERNARAQSRLITDLLDVSQLIRGRLPVRMFPTDLRRPIACAVENARTAAAVKGVKLEYEGGTMAMPVLGDDDRLEQMVSNLLSNAVKFTPRGGRVSVAINKNGQSVNVQVTDTGEGIVASEFQRLFDPFFQAETQAMRAGLGLGLAIVKELVALHGGKVVVTSGGRGKGATFSIALPLVGAPAPDAVAGTA